jgi:hypothetical protein
MLISLESSVPKRPRRRSASSDRRVDSSDSTAAILPDRYNSFDVYKKLFPTFSANLVSDLCAEEWSANPRSLRNVLSSLEKFEKVVKLTSVDTLNLKRFLGRSGLECPSTNVEIVGKFLACIRPVKKSCSYAMFKAMKTRSSVKISCFIRSVFLNYVGSI